MEYTLKDVVATLCMVETPFAAITVSTPEERDAPKDTKEPLLETGPTITLVHQKPITSSIRGTIRHLVSQAGRLARWRGFKIHVLHGLCFSLVANIVSAALPIPDPVRMIIATAVSGAICANLHAAWTHKVVSMPTATRFWQRVPARSNWKLLAFPAAVSAAMPYFSLSVAHGFIPLFGLDRAVNDNFREYNGHQWTSLILRWIAVLVIAISCTIFLCLPAIVTLVRVEASILPEDQDTIVPFDRTFAGKVVPRILGGTGCISFLDAWRSFNWEARRRLIKLYVKIFFILTGLFFVLAHVLAFEVFVIMGPALGKFLSEARQQGHLS